MSIDSSHEPHEPGQDALAAVESEESQGQVHEALDKLPEDVREVAHLFYLGSQSHKEIAEFLELAPAVVNNRLYQARKRLRKDLRAMAIEDLQSQRPSKDERFVDNVVSQTMTRDELNALDRLHDGFSDALSETLSQVAGREVIVQTAWVDLTYYELLVASFFFPVATFKCTLGPAGEGVFLSLSATAVRVLLNGDEKLQDGDTRHLTPDQILAFHETASNIIRDLRNMWSHRDLGLRCLEVSNNGPALTWSMERGLVPAGFARPESVVVIIGLEITMEGIEYGVLNPTNRDPQGNPNVPAVVLCYNYEVVKANAL